MSWEFSRVLFLSRITIDRFSACFLSCSPRCSEPAQGLLTSSLSRMPKLMKWRWIHFSLWRKNILTRTVSLLYFWEDGSGCSTNSFHSIKTHTSLITKNSGWVWDGTASPAGENTLFICFLSVFRPPFFFTLPIFPFSTSPCNIFSKGHFYCNFKMTKRQYPLHRSCVHCSCVHLAHHCGDMI